MFDGCLDLGLCPKFQMGYEIVHVRLHINWLKCHESKFPYLGSSNGLEAECEQLMLDSVYEVIDVDN